MKYVIKHRGVCRICNHGELLRFLHFDNMPLTDGFVSTLTVGTEFLAPLDVYWCNNCFTVQTLHDVEADEYYCEYRYRVSNSDFAQRFMQKLANETFRRFKFEYGDRVIEIGSGDGYQLSSFQKIGARVLGFEPSESLTKISIDAGVPVIKRLFDAKTVVDNSSRNASRQGYSHIHIRSFTRSPTNFFNA